MGMGPHTQCRRRSNRGWKQASLSFWKMKYCRVLIRCISSQMPGRPGGSTCQMGYLRGQAGIDPVTVCNTRTKQGDRKSSAFWHLHAAAVFHGRRFWRLTSWHITLDVTRHWPLCSFSSLEWCSRLPADPRATEDHIKAVAQHSSSLLKHTQSALTRNVEEQMEFLGFSPGSSSDQWFLILKAALHGRSASS